jgi:hypothetical protein
LAVSPDDQRLVAALTVLRDQLAPVVDEIVFGELGGDDRRRLAHALRIVADALCPPAAPRAAPLEIRD